MLPHETLTTFRKNDRYCPHFTEKRARRPRQSSKEQWLIRTGDGIRTWIVDSNLGSTPLPSHRPSWKVQEVTLGQEEGAQVDIQKSSEQSRAILGLKGLRFDPNAHREPALGALGATGPSGCFWGPMRLCSQPTGTGASGQPASGPVSPILQPTEPEHRN